MNCCDGLTHQKIVDKMGTSRTWLRQGNEQVLEILRRGNFADSKPLFERYKPGIYRHRLSDMECRRQCPGTYSRADRKTRKFLPHFLPQCRQIGVNGIKCIYFKNGLFTEKIRGNND